jgi:hypothetical protein
MSVVAFDEGDLFTVVVEKSLHSNPNLTFRNSYEFQAQEAGSTENLITMGEALVAFEKAMTLETADFVELRIATWEPDSSPYNPATFLALPLTGTGDRTLGEGEEVALNVCLSVARVPQSGRFGHIFYRDALKKPDIIAPSGDWIFEDQDAYDTLLAGALTSSGIDGYLDGSQVLRMVMVDKDGTFIRSVLVLSPQGISTLPTKHKWFNRTPTP